jgi:hypothetical protein
VTLGGRAAALAPRRCVLGAPGVPRGDVRRRSRETPKTPDLPISLDVTEKGRPMARWGIDNEDFGW